MENILETKCPNCGSRKTEIKITENRQYVVCSKCGAIRSKIGW